MCYLLENSSIPNFSEKFMSAQCDSSFFIHFIPSPGQLAINFLLCKSILECKILLIAFFANSLTFYPPILDNLAFLHKYLYIGKYHLH